LRTRKHNVEWHKREGFKHLPELELERVVVWAYSKAKEKRK